MMSAPEKYQEALRRELQRVLSSRGFVQSKRLSDFLRFVVEQHLDGKDHELKETTIAIQVFGRNADYDSRQDSIVRTEAGRLRSKLTEYYMGKGNDDPVVIELPKGGYIPAFRFSDVVRRGHRNIFRPVRFSVALVSLVLVLAVMGLWWVRQRSAPIEIAVLPLENLSGDAGNEYFADGLTDEVIRNLSVIEGLAVRSRTSSFAFRGVPRNLREVGEQLGVDYIVEGSVLREGPRLRINTQLVRVRDDFPLWSGRFDRELTNIFTIQDEISLGVVNNLRLQLGRGRRRYETSIEAYDLYLRGRALNPIPSIELFEQVISKDPLFAPAYAGLASAYAFRSVQFPVNHPDDELPKMRAAAEKAIQLDPLLAEAHEALAMAYARNGEWEQAEKGFRHAIELDANRSETYANFAYWLLTALGRVEEALQQLRLAEQIDPLSPSVHRFLPDVLISLGRYEEAADYCQKMPTNQPLRNPYLARAELGRGRVGEAIQVLGDAWTSPNPLIRGFAGYIYARSDRREEAERLAAASNFANEQALTFAGLGDKDRTLAALDRMAVLGAQRVGIFLNYPEMALLRDDPRLKAFRKKVGLPD
jgi:TolB-like protein/Flp pilus assembly protein TadD